jgi:hypothetical protein
MLTNMDIANLIVMNSEVTLIVELLNTTNEGYTLTAEDVE